MRPSSESSSVRPVELAPFVRTSFDLSRIELVFTAALLPCLAMALYNTGLQANLAIAAGAVPLRDGRSAVLEVFAIPFDPSSLGSCVALGAAYFLPLFVACAVGARIVEWANGRLRRRPESDTWRLFALLLVLTLPPTTPLWQAAMGAAFGTLFGQEIFGGPGMGFVHPVLLGRAFLFFAYPAGMSGDTAWVAASVEDFDGYSGATPLTRALLDQAPFAEVSWWDSFMGFIPGSMGETSVVASALGGGVLLATRIASAWTMVGVALGTFACSSAFEWSASPGDVMASLPFHWHAVLGSWAFATVFLATDPTSSPFTNPGRLIYGFAVGALAIVIRVANAAYADGMMLAILFMNVFSPLINYVSIQLHVRRRSRRFEV